MSTVRLEVLGGTGTVCRRGDVVAWFPPGAPTEWASVVLEAARLACLDGAAALGLAHAVQEALEGTEQRRIPVAVARLGSPTAAVVVAGSVVVADHEVQRLSGEDADGLVEADLGFERLLTVRGSDDPDVVRRPGCLPFELVEGVVPGGGFVMHAPSGTRRADRHGQGGAVPEGVVLFDLSQPQRGAERAPLPMSEGDGSLPRHAAPDQAPAPPPKGRAEPTDVGEIGPTGSSPAGELALVPGIRCARGHFNHPDALYCRQCGLGMVQKSAVLENGPRPSLGVLIVDDGSTFSLDHDYVIGRSPQSSDEVRAGSARALPLDDGTGQISRAHARIALNGWSVVVSDLGSRNGTHVLNPGETTWRLLGKNDTVALEAGGRLAIGQRKMEFQTLQRR